MSFAANVVEKSMFIKPRIEKLQLGRITFYDIAEHFSKRPHFAFLDSRINENNLGRFSFLCFEPFFIVKSKGRRVWTEQGNKREYEREGSLFGYLNKILSKYQISSENGREVSPFLGGGIGYFAYELGRQVEELPKTTRDELKIPECYLCFYNCVIIYNHEKEEVYISHFDPRCRCNIHSIEQIKEEIEAISPGRYNEEMVSRGWKRIKEGEILSEFKSDFTKDEYLEGVNRIKEYIFAGDVYQVNLTQRFQTELGDIASWELYKRLMHINPSPFASYLNFDEVCVVSSSPERFLRVEGRDVETRPIKGTTKRGATPQEDARNKRYLFNDEKNRAELAMIVDLLRNDLGRVCKPGTVRVRAFPELETYASMHHLVSTITGELIENRGIGDLLTATFPGGSITGAPKIRAMEIIDELEPIERGIYTGSIGYLGFNGCADLNIVIRTIIVKEGKAHIQVGGGIVADSVDRDEYQETLLKANKLFKAFIIEE